MGVYCSGALQVFLSADCTKKKNRICQNKYGNNDNNNFKKQNKTENSTKSNLKE